MAQDGFSDNKAIQQLPTQKQLTDSLQNIGRADTIKNAQAVKAKAIQQKADSIGQIPHSKVEEVQGFVNQKAQNLENKADSITNLPDRKITEARRKVEERLARKRQKIEQKAAKKAEKRAAIQAKAGKVKGLEDKANQKMQSVGADGKAQNALNKVGVQKPGLEGAKEKLNLPSQGGIKDKAKGLTEKTNLELPDQRLPTGNAQELTEKAKSKVGEIDGIEKAKGSLGEIKKMPGEKLGNIEGADKVKGKLGDAKSVSGKVKGYTEEAKDIADGKAIEARARNLEEVKGLEEKTKAFDGMKQKPEEYKAKMEKYQDKDFVKQEMKRKAMQLGTDHFANHQDKLKSAQQQLSKYKKKYHSLQSTKDINLKKIPNGMKGKKFRERIIFGGTFQVFDNPEKTIDFSPQVGYKISGRWTAGLAGAYWVRIEKDGYTPNVDDKTYGLRLYSDFKVFKGFFVKGEVEVMSTLVPRYNSNNQEEIRREHVNAAFLGIGKRYNFLKGLKGNVQVLYNFMHNNDSPYPRRFNMKFGFEFGIKKKKRQNNTDNKLAKIKKTKIESQVSEKLKRRP